MSLSVTNNRWHVVATYHSDSGDFDVEYWIEELVELQEIIECGPSWYALRDIVIVLNVPECEKITVEKALAE